MSYLVEVPIVGLGRLGDEHRVFYVRSFHISTRILKLFRRKTQEVIFSNLR